MFNQMLSSKKITRTAIKEALRRLKKSGISKPELEEFLGEMMNGKQKSHLAFCTDEEAMKIDRVIGEVLAKHTALKALLYQHYEGRGMSMRKMAERLNEQHPEWGFRTCCSRIDQWLRVTEYILYKPMRDAFGFCTN